MRAIISDNVIGDQEGLNDMIKDRLHNRIGRGAKNAQTAVQRLIEEGRVSKDYIAPLGITRQGLDPAISFYGNGSLLMNLEDNLFTMHNHAVGHVAEKLKLPTRYLKDLANGKDQWQRSLAARILNDHTNWTPRERVLVRAVGGEVRGVLSDSYKRMNSQQIFQTFIEEGLKAGAELADGLMNDTKMFVEMLLPNPIVIPTAKNGDVVIAFGIRLSNSDYGDGALEMRSFMMQGICLNGWVKESVMREIHLGQRLPDNLSLSERTYRLDTNTQKSAIRDITGRLLSRDAIERNAVEIQDASEISVDPTKELKSLSGRLLKNEVEEVTQRLIDSRQDDGITGESTLWKLVNGVTATARDKAESDPTRAREMQEVAGFLMKRVSKK